MKKRLLISAVTVGIITTMLILLWVNAKDKKEKTEFIFSYAENQNEDYPTTKGARRFAELVEEKSKGRIKILVQANSELGDEGEVIEQMKFGGIDFARISISSLTETIPEYNVLMMPYLYRDSDHMWSVLDGKIGDHFLEELQDYNLVGLSWYDAGARSFYNSVRPIKTVEDLEGLTIRVQGVDSMIDLVEALGAKTQVVQYADIYSNLQLGKVDGAENNIPSYESMDHFKVAKYFSLDEHTRQPELQICSKNTWDQLSEEDKEIISESAKESAIYQREVWRIREESAKARVIEQGTIINTISEENLKEFQKRSNKIYAKYCKNYVDIIAEIKNTATTKNTGNTYKKKDENE